MQAEITLIPAASPAATVSARTPSLPSAPSGFGATLSSFTSSAGAEHLQSQPVTTAQAAKSNANSALQPASKVSVKSSLILNSPSSTSKPVLKPDVDTATGLASTPQAALPPIHLPSTASIMNVQLLAGFEQSVFSVPPPNPELPSPNPSTVAPQLNANVGSLASPAASLAAPIIAFPAQAVSPGELLPTPALPSFPRQADITTTSGITTASTGRSTTNVAPNFLADKSGNVTQLGNLKGSDPAQPSLLAAPIVANPAQIISLGEYLPQPTPAPVSFPPQTDSTVTSDNQIPMSSGSAAVLTSDLSKDLTILPEKSGTLSPFAANLENITSPSALPASPVADVPLHKPQTLSSQTLAPAEFFSPTIPVPASLPRQTDSIASLANTAPTTAQSAAVLENLTSPVPSPLIFAVPPQTHTPVELVTAPIAASLPHQFAAEVTAANTNLTTSTAAAVLAPNLSETPAILPGNPGTSNVPANYQVPVEAGPPSPRASFAIVPPTPDAGPPVPGLTAQPSGVTRIASAPLPVFLASTNAMDTSSAQEIVSAARPRGVEPSSDPNNSPVEPVVPSFGSPSPSTVGAPALNISLQAVPAPAGLPTSTPIPAPTQRSSSAPAPQSSASENDLELLTAPLNTKAPADSSSSDAKSSDSTPRIVRPENSTPISPAPAQPAPGRGLAVSDTSPAAALAANSNPMAASFATGSEAGFAAVNNPNPASALANNDAPSSTSNLAPNPNAAAGPPLDVAAITGDGPANAKLAVSPASDPVPISSATSAYKKSAAASSNTTPALAGTPSTNSSFAASSAVAGPASAKDFSVPVAAPAPPSAPPSAGNDPAPELPKAHQMLDSAPPAPTAPSLAPLAPLATGSTADAQTNLQMNTQMHVGVRTDAFGAVEIHTVVQQSQIGITVHADRDIARWFNSEIPSLESGLNKSHLNLTAVDFESGRSGLDTASSFQHGQPRQQFSESDGASSLARADTTAEKDQGLEPATIDSFPADRFAGPEATRVSIHA